MSNNYELELYKLIMLPDIYDRNCSYVSELGWENNCQFFIWIPYTHIKDFIDGLVNIFGYELFGDENFKVSLQSDGICIELNELLPDVNLEAIFPKDKFKH